MYWYNGQWIRKIFDEKGAEALYTRTKDFWPESAKEVDDDYKVKVFSIIYDRLKTLSDLRSMTDYFFKEPKIDLDMLVKNKFLKKMPESEIESLLKLVVRKLSDINKWDADSIQAALNELLNETKKKPAELFSLIRIAISFAPFSPALNLTLEVLGKETSLARLNAVASAI